MYIAQHEPTLNRRKDSHPACLEQSSPALVPQRHSEPPCLGTGWWNDGDGDMKFFTAMLEQFNANLCIDQERIFSTGLSFGANMSYSIGFQFDVFRAIAPSSGRLGGILPYAENNAEPLAIMALHGDSDALVKPSFRTSRRSCRLRSARPPTRRRWARMRSRRPSAC